MRLIVKIGNVYQTGTWEKDTYSEVDEEYETFTENMEKARRELFNLYSGIYDIKQKNPNLIVAWVY